MNIFAWCYVVCSTAAVVISFIPRRWWDIVFFRYLPERASYWYLRNFG